MVFTCHNCNMQRMKDDELKFIKYDCCDHLICEICYHFRDDDNFFCPTCKEDEKIIKINLLMDEVNRCYQAAQNGGELNLDELIFYFSELEKLNLV